MKLMSNLSDESVLAKCESLGFDNVQAKEILSHLRKYGLDLLPCVDTGMSPYEIDSVGHFMNLSKCMQYADPKYHQDQMAELRIGLEQGLNISKYANCELDWRKMHDIRCRLLEKKKLNES